MEKNYSAFFNILSKNVSGIRRDAIETYVLKSETPCSLTMDTAGT